MVFSIKSYISMSGSLDCPLWKENYNMHITSSSKQVTDPSITNAETCKAYCLSHQPCASCDYDFSRHSCWVALTANPTKEQQMNCNNYELNNNCISGTNVTVLYLVISIYLSKIMFLII